MLGRQSRIGKFNNDHKDFICNQETLERQCGKTLQERAKLFHRAFPDTSISSTTLATLYRKRRIKKKRIVFKKVLTVNLVLRQEPN